jgi:hypothetical protein
MEKEAKAKEWTAKETRAFYESLLERALNTIPESGAVMVLGPIFAIRTIEENAVLFGKAILDLKKEGMDVFNQWPFLDRVQRDAPFDYKAKFEIFYKSLIESGKITECYLLPDWEKSEGTRSEIAFCEEAGVPTYEL